MCVASALLHCCRSKWSFSKASVLWFIPWCFPDDFLPKIVSPLTLSSLTPKSNRVSKELGYLVACLRGFQKSPSSSLISHWLGDLAKNQALVRCYAPTRSRRAAFSLAEKRTLCFRFLLIFFKLKYSSVSATTIAKGRNFKLAYLVNEWDCKGIIKIRISWINGLSRVFEFSTFLFQKFRFEGRLRPASSVFIISRFNLKLIEVQSWFNPGSI